MPTTTRRQWLLGTGAGIASLGLPACVDWRRTVGPREQRLVSRARLPLVQWRLEAPDYGSVLRRRAISARALPDAFLARLDRGMRETLARSGGVGLAAPQVGIGRRVILVQRPQPGKPVVTLVDPVITWASLEAVGGYEACLSVSGVGGRVLRSRRLRVRYFDLSGHPRRLEAEGWEARILQHEVDHLEGILYLDRLAGPLLPIDEMRRRRRARPRPTARAGEVHPGPRGPTATADRLLAGPRGEDVRWCLL